MSKPVSNLFVSASGHGRAQTTSTVRHECGHLIVAQKCGFETGEIKIGQLQASAAIFLFPSISSVQDVIKFSENRMKVLLAGAMAESLKSNKTHHPTANNLLTKGTAANDFAKYRELCRLLTGCQFPNLTMDEFAKKLADIDQRIFNEAATLVNSEATRIVALTVHFMGKWDRASEGKESPVEDFELSHSEISEFLSSLKQG